VLPEDTAFQKLIVSVNCYSKKYGEDIEAELEEIDDFSAKVNAPVIIGEFGTRIVDFTLEHRQKLAANYVARAAGHGIKCFWWDDNKSKAYRIINRQELLEFDFRMICALIEGAQGNANVLPDTQVLNTVFHFVRGLCA